MLIKMVKLLETGKQIYSLTKLKQKTTTKKNKSWMDDATSWSLY